jgi:two-component system, cell cycle response regulator DivK
MHRKVVLVVEDNTDELMIYTTLLNYAGYDVLPAESYETALRVATENRPDLAIIDVNLGNPNYDGCDLVNAFRADDRTCSMPVIAHTAFGDVYRNALENAGCSTILHKPNNPTVIIDAVRQLIGPGAEEADGAPAGKTDVAG